MTPVELFWVGVAVLGLTPLVRAPLAYGIFLAAGLFAVGAAIWMGALQW